MEAISLNRSRVLHTAVVWLLTFAALVLLGLVLAYWTWVWLAPRPEPRVQPAAEPEGRIESAYGLFGEAYRGHNGAAPRGVAITLLGVVAAEGGRSGFAIVRVEEKDILAVREGREIVPGIRVSEVDKDHIILERNGNREMLAWPETKTLARPGMTGSAESPAPRNRE